MDLAEKIWAGNEKAMDGGDVGTAAAAKGRRTMTPPMQDS